MPSLSPARQALAGLDLVPGLAVSEVHSRLRQGLRLRDAGQRIVAFYLVEMEDRRLHNTTGHRSAGHFAETRLGMDPRRARELIAVGRTLLELPALDAAFCEHRMGWAKLVLLTRVATPEHEEAWLERALRLSWRELALEVKLTRPGQPPRGPGERKGLPEVRFRLSTSLDVLTHQKLDLAKQKLSAERGRPVDDAELLAVLAELFLDLEEDGSVPGRTRVSSSLYRVVLRPDGTETDARLLVDTDLGPLPIDGNEADGVAAPVRSACLRCDGEDVVATETNSHEEAGGKDLALDSKTSPGLRRRVLARDGHRCRCCGSRHRLMVHHIHPRGRGGRTRMVNLVTLCASCHSLVHAGLLVLVGESADAVHFHDAEGRALDDPGAHVPDAVRLPLGRRRLDPLSVPQPEDAPHAAEPRLVSLDGVPAEVDGAWWRRHAPLLRSRSGRGFGLREGVRPPAQEAAGPTDPPRGIRRGARAFQGLIGQDALIRRLAAIAEGSRARDKPFPHTLFLGPAGTGKTTLARAVASCAGARLHQAAGPLLGDAHVLVGLLAELREGDMLFIDEVHAVPRSVLETLYEAMAARSVSCTLHAGPRTRDIRLRLPAFTLLAATTEDGDLPAAMYSRFGLREHLGPYSSHDLVAVLTARARAEGATLGLGAARRLAEFARGTPREALRLLDRVLDGRATAETPLRIDEPAVEEALDALGYDRDGLDPTERRYLGTLRASPVPIPLERLARMLGTSVRTLLHRIEPYLFHRGLIRMTRRGRVAAGRPRLLEIGGSARREEA